jgi:demethylmenaquinone methyltransferase/2-methoxy-6-polyprenyl-1,4-benzoquinol methylase
MPRDNRVRTYDALSRWYRLLSDPSEAPMRREGLAMLGLRPGETVLEIGSGPGMDLPVMAEQVGEAGSVWGLDLSSGMLHVSRRTLRHDRRALPVRLVQGDAIQLPFRSHALDAVQLSFTLELFADSEIPRVLREAGRVMRREGRLGVVCLSNHHPDEVVTRLYWRAHRSFPGVIDCRPINASEILEANGYTLRHAVVRSMWGIRVAVLVACRR